MIIDLALECWVVLKAGARAVSRWGQLHNHRNLGWSKNTANRRESFSEGKVLRQCTALVNAAPASEVLASLQPWRPQEVVSGFQALSFIFMRLRCLCNVRPVTSNQKITVLTPTFQPETTQWDILVKPYFGCFLLPPPQHCFTKTSSQRDQKYLEFSLPSGYSTQVLKHSHVYDIENFEE